MGSTCTLNEIKFHRFDEHYRYLSEESKAKYSLDYFRKLKDGKASIERDEAKALHKEIAVSEFCCLAENKYIPFKSVEEIFDTALNIEGFNSGHLVMNKYKGKDGNIRSFAEKVPAFNGVPLDYCVATQAMIASVKKISNSDKEYMPGKTIKSLQEKDVIFKFEVSEMFKSFSNSSEKSKMLKALEPYMERAEHVKLKEMTYDTSKDNFNDLKELCKKYFNKVEFVADEKYGNREVKTFKNVDGKLLVENEKKSGELVLDEPKITLAQEKTLYNDFVGKNSDEKACAEELARLKTLTLKEAREEEMKLPITSAQKFQLDFMMGVDRKEYENLNRQEAQKKIEMVSKEIAGYEVSSDIRKHAEEYNLVKAGESYTNEQWNKDCFKVPPTEELEKLAFNLCAVNKVKAAYVARVQAEGEPSGISYGDFINAITQHYNNVDIHKNGPVMEYQINALGTDHEYKNWQEAEEAYLNKCYIENILEKDELVFLKKANKEMLVIPNSITEKLYDESLSKQERGDLAFSIKDKLHTAMREKMSLQCFNANEPPRPENRSNPYYCVAHAIHETVPQPNKPNEVYSVYIEHTSSPESIKAIARNTFEKSKYHLGVDQIEKVRNNGSIINGMNGIDAKEVMLVSDAIINCAPGLVGKGSYVERFEKVKECVKQVKMEMLSKDKEKLKQNVQVSYKTQDVSSVKAEAVKAPVKSGRRFGGRGGRE